jgi:hypothetical protein
MKRAATRTLGYHRSLPCVSPVLSACMRVADAHIGALYPDGVLSPLFKLLVASPQSYPICSLLSPARPPSLSTLSPPPPAPL